MGRIKYYKILPEVPASIGDRSEFERIPGLALKLKRVHLIFEGWLGGDLLETSPIFYITDKLRRAMLKSSLTGISEFKPIDEITKSSAFIELYSEKDLPKFYQIRLFGKPFIDDFGIDNGYLIVSDEARKILSNFNLSNSDIIEVDRID